MTQACCIQQQFVLSLIALFPSLTITFSFFLLIPISKSCSLASIYQTLCHHLSNIELFKYLAPSTATNTSHPSLLTFGPHQTSQEHSNDAYTTNLSAQGTWPFFSAFIPGLSSSHYFVQNEENAHILKLPTVID